MRLAAFSLLVMFGRPKPPCEGCLSIWFLVYPGGLCGVMKVCIIWFNFFMCPSVGGIILPEYKIVLMIWESTNLLLPNIVMLLVLYGLIFALILFKALSQFKFVLSLYPRSKAIPSMFMLSCLTVLSNFNSWHFSLLILAPLAFSKLWSVLVFTRVQP